MSSNKLPPNLMPAMYSHRIHEIATIGYAYGYAMAVHGSMQRDLDIVAVPWTDKAKSAQALVKALCGGLGCKAHGEPSDKPHGRLAYTLTMGGACFMDLSIVPRRPVRP